MSRPTHLQQIEQIKIVPHLPNAPAMQKHKHTVLGKEFYEGLGFWTKAKSIIDGEILNKSLLYGRLNKNDLWDFSDAFGARKSESVKEYRIRVGDKQRKAIEIDMRSIVINKWMNRPVQC